MAEALESRDSPFLVAGGGIGGLTLARALEVAGIENRVLERTAELREVGAGITVQANAMLALRHLGLETTVRDAGQVVDTVSIWADDGRDLGTASLRPVHAALGAESVVIHRGALQMLLLDSLSRTTVSLGHEVISVKDGGGALLDAGLADRSQVSGWALAACDGRASTVRRAVFEGEAPLRYSGYTTWRGIAEGPPARPVGTATEIWGRGRRFGLVALGADRLYWYATESVPPYGEDPPGGRSELLGQRFASFPPVVRQALEATGEGAILRTDIFDRPPPQRWYRGRVALLGDAAHPMEPNLGQGGCQAIEDAVVLADCLRRHSRVTAAFADYEMRRRRRAAWYVRTSRSFGLLTQRLPGWLYPVRDTLFALMPASSLTGSMKRRGAFRL